MMCGTNNIYLPGLDHPEQELNVVENVLKYFLLTDSEVRVVIIGVGADVDDAVHVKVQVVEFGNLVLLDDLAQARVALAQPAIELGYPHSVAVGMMR